VNDGLVVSDLRSLHGGKFGTVYADPPWSYSNASTRGAADDHYGTMSVDQIAALPVKDHVRDDAHLHIWTTNGFLPDTFRVMEAWGFTYKSSFVWVKPNIGMGNYWRVSHEFLLLGVRGNATFRDKSLRSWVEVARDEHSSKPDQVRSYIERASPGPFLEMFGRKAVPFWTVMGNDVKRDLFTQSIPTA
jgi:N6-adenosine-specific RNA methylase IME4